MISELVKPVPKSILCRRASLRLVQAAIHNERVGLPVVQRPDTPFDCGLTRVQRKELPK